MGAWVMASALAATGMAACGGNARRGTGATKDLDARGGPGIARGGGGGAGTTNAGSTGELGGDVGNDARGGDEGATPGEDVSGMIGECPHHPLSEIEMWDWQPSDLRTVAEKYCSSQSEGEEPYYVYRADTTCDGDAVSVSSRWVSKQFFFDSTPELVAYYYGSDFIEDCKQYGQRGCRELEGTERPLCRVEGSVVTFGVDTVAPVDPGVCLQLKLSQIFEGDSRPSDPRAAADLLCPPRYPGPYYVHEGRSSCGGAAFRMETAWGSEAYFFDQNDDLVAKYSGSEYQGVCTVYGRSDCEIVADSLSLLCSWRDEPESAPDAGAAGAGGASTR